jgi:hypothetical protein
MNLGVHGAGLPSISTFSARRHRRGNGALGGVGGVASDYARLMAMWTSQQIYLRQWIRNIDMFKHRGTTLAMRLCETSIAKRRAL